MILASFALRFEILSFSRLKVSPLIFSHVLMFSAGKNKSNFVEALILLIIDVASMICDFVMTLNFESLSLMFFYFKRSHKKMLSLSVRLLKGIKECFHFCSKGTGALGVRILKAITL